ncbi:amino acid/amide ABC transporter membrane protein 2, HAAT family [Roseovarius nanhaiticus]|uniref:Amino acid/amide ABC transporter membrane protein 2, HAAT family n=1 Tax=Roseovarius nanhaiticus TaxID=573024 RepID=A0A1N7HPA3_9RHOB|nr:branched-chain amino acid ABC transporter permease [Roseovarius nanhaiticus]SEL40052.1 amino acid/amide ABC transporter membrane protein 2, HAAT family [Roseovarius nanhaiticus]SIS26520.1 amino acid/amide ABC transporter membrane protein 2, HAAT family [Roseovarius nanhaiticus]
MSLKNKLIYPVLLAALVIAPVLAPGYMVYILCMIGIYYIVGLAMNVLVAQAGQISIGHAAFWALGAYGAAVLVTRFDIPFEIAILCGGLLAAVFGLLVAIPAMRVQGHYLAIATLAFSMVVERTLHEWETVTGGRSGMFVPRPSVLGTELVSDMPYFYLIMLISLIFTWMIYNLQRAPSGRALQALRLSPTAASSSGVNRRASLVTVFVLSAFMTGISGGLFAHLVGYLSVSSFTLAVSLSFITMIVIGGAGRLMGAFIGAAFVTLMPEFMRGLAEAQMVAYGVILILVVLFLPEGLAGLTRRIAAALSRSPGGASACGKGGHL